MRNSAIMMWLTELMVVINLFLAVQTMFVLYASLRLGASPALTAVVVAAGGLGGMAGAATAPRLSRRFPPVPVILAATLHIGVALAVIGAAHHIWWLAAGNALLLWADVLAGIVIRTLRQRIAPREMLGRVTAVMRSAALAATTVGAVLAGTLAQLCDGNPRPVILGAAIALAAVIPLAWIAGPHRRGEVRIPDDETTLAAT